MPGAMLSSYRAKSDYGAAAIRPPVASAMWREYKPSAFQPDVSSTPARIAAIDQVTQNAAVAGVAQIGASESTTAAS